MYKITIHTGYANEWSANVVAGDQYAATDRARARFVADRTRAAEREWAFAAPSVEDLGLEVVDG